MLALILFLACSGDVADAALVDGSQYLDPVPDLEDYEEPVEEDEPSAVEELDDLSRDLETLRALLREAHPVEYEQAEQEIEQELEAEPETDLDEILDTADESETALEEKPEG